MCSVLNVMAQVDMAPTWLALAGLSKPSHMDGKSITPLIVDPAAAGVPSQTKAAIAALAPKGKAAYAAAWRDSIFIEYRLSPVHGRPFRNIISDLAQNPSYVDLG